MDPGYKSDSRNIDRVQRPPSIDSAIVYFTSPSVVLLSDLLLSSSMFESGEHYFEGVEKLLEIWFEESSNSENDLRNITR